MDTENRIKIDQILQHKFFKKKKKKRKTRSVINKKLSSKSFIFNGLRKYKPFAEEEISA